MSVTLGLASSDAPLQRWLFLGGTQSLRGFEGGFFRGTGAWMARTEVGTWGEGIRGVLFADAGWAGPREEITAHRPAVSAGAGLSLMDGMLRMDLARGVVRGNAWRLHFYLDGLF
jgi:hemolysin activation/secretion protein